jgi:CubicO group peptidase (beta-lactamase class C family)
VTLAVLDLVRARGAAAQLCVVRGGEVVVDEAFGCAHDDLFLIFSAGKPFVAMLVHILAERGLIGLDEPVAEYWPEFAANGKQTITVRHVLQHRSGVPVATSVAGDALRATNWERSVRALEQSRPRWSPGEVPAYHILSYGFILGELVQRVTGRDLRDVLADQVTKPLGLADTHLGLPDPLWTRRVPVQGGGVRGLIFNYRGLRQAKVPAATMTSTARDLARFYQALLRGGELDGVRVCAPWTVEAARAPSSDGELDRVLRLPIRWSAGFQLGGPGRRADSRPDRRPRPMGHLSSVHTFGHNGSNCCLGWADPDRDLVLVYLTNRLQVDFDGSPHQCAVSDAVLRMQ